MTGSRGDPPPVSDEGERVPVSVAWILLAALAAALFLTTQMRAPDTLETEVFPALASGLDVVPVADAIEVRETGADTDVAVSGWFQQPMVIECPAPGIPLVPVIEGPCALTGWLMGEPESVVHVSVEANSREHWTTSASGPSIETVFDGPGSAWANPLRQNGDSVPTSVVLIGHFNDPRVAACQAENQAECRDRFVVTVVAWADGVENP